MATTAKSRTARKIVGSLGVLGATAAVAGLGTFGTFTDSTTPITTQVASGTVDIDLTNPGYAIPATTSGFVPGDSLTRAVTLTNSGTSALSSVTLSTTATVSSILTTNTTNGLQLGVRSCSQPWTQGGTSAAPVYTCGGTVTDLGTTPVVGNRTLAGMNSLNPGGTDHLTFTISLPTAADNAFQGKSSTLSLVFTGTQRAAAAR
ncbi:TasA family protein [Trujillonella humicola]|uniref:TasA family protein n=1 Tax=Trujillonella humicola TaxID=3383699 RepID=UPI003906C055